MKIEIRDPTNDQENFDLDWNKDEDVGVIMNYISQNIWFHLYGIDLPHQLWRKMKLLFHWVNISHVMQLVKQLISLDPHSFDRMEEYLACVNKIHMQFGKCGNNY